MRDRREDPNSARSFEVSSHVNAENQLSSGCGVSVSTVNNLELLKAELATALQLAMLGSWSWDIKTGLMTWSDELYRFFGLRPQEIPASFEAGVERVHPEDRNGVLQSVERSLKTGATYSQPCRIIRTDGKIRLLQVLGRVVAERDGTPIRMFGHCQDITELETAKHAWRTAERKYHQIFDNACLGIFQSTPEGRYITANPALARMHGFDSPEELIASCRDITHQIYVDPSRRDEFKRLIEKYGVVRGFEHESLRKDGTKTWILVNARAVRDESGKILYYEGTTQDVTERKQAEQALRESEERYRDLVENSLELICTHDLQGKILSVNRAACRLFGYELDELGREANIRDMLAPEVRDQFDDYMARILREGATSGTMLVETRSGERRLLEYYNSLRTEGVEAPIVRGIARDITQRRQAEQAMRASEERYRELFENSKDALYVHDMSGRFTSVNRAAERLTGYKREELIGKHFSGFLSPQHARHVRAHLCKILKAAGETTYEVEILRKQRSPIPVEVSSRLILEQGNAVGVQGSVRDISERKRAREASRTYSRRLIEAQEAERRRISRELHDQVGQILTAVKMNLHALRQKCSTPEILSSIEDNMGVIDEAVDQVRHLSVDLRPLLLDDFGLVVAVRWYLDRQTKNCGVPAEFITRSLSEDDRFTSELETACFRIVQEAVTNVVRHAHASRISVVLERVGAELILLIKDDGQGFDARVLRSGAAGATTLGLRGMEERVEAIGGSITIDTAPTVGTEICARLPVRYDPSRTTQAPSVEWAEV